MFARAIERAEWQVPSPTQPVFLHQEFKRNIANGQRTISASLRDLHGLPEDFMDRVRKNADADGNVNLTTQYTDYSPVMKYAESDMLRQRMLEAYNSRAYPENKVDGPQLKLCILRFGASCCSYVTMLYNRI